VDMVVFEVPGRVLDWRSHIAYLEVYFEMSVQRAVGLGRGSRPRA